MNKDKNLLCNVSDLFTEAVLENIFCKATGEQSSSVLCWEFGEINTKGDSYLSTIDKIIIRGEAKGKPIEIRLVVKSLPKNLGRRKSFRSTDFFYNEVTFYNEVVPKFEEFLRSKGHAKLLSVPRCFMAVTDGQNDYVVLEDVSPLGFKSMTRQNCASIAECNIILETMARFHAVSFAYKDQYQEEFQKLAGKLRETYYDYKLWDWYKNFQSILIRVAKDALAKEYPNSKAEERFNSYKPRELYDKSVEFCGRVNAPTSVINQGDSWAPNFMAREIAENKYEALMIDFQLARCASPVLDVAFFIYSCTNKVLRDKYFDQLLMAYHRELTKTITLLDSNPEKLYPWNVFLEEIHEQCFHGVNFSLEAVPFCTLNESESIDLDLIEGDEAVDIANAWNLSNLKSKEDRCRLAEMIVHAVEKGYM